MFFSLPCVPQPKSTFKVRFYFPFRFFFLSLTLVWHSVRLFVMPDDELSTTDVLIDPSKNLGNVFNSLDLDDDSDHSDTVVLPDNEYLTETDFIELTKTANLRKTENLLILSLSMPSFFALSNISRRALSAALCKASRIGGR